MIRQYMRLWYVNCCPTLESSQRDFRISCIAIQEASGHLQAVGAVWEESVCN
jgi:hypothetical protein